MPPPPRTPAEEKRDLALVDRLLQKYWRRHALGETYSRDFRREVERIDRRIMDERTSPEQQRELWRRRHHRPDRYADRPDAVDKRNGPYLSAAGTGRIFEDHQSYAEVAFQQQRKATNMT